MFFAFYSLCFFAKGLYFLLVPQPLFSLKQYPQPGELWAYTLLAMLTAALFGGLIYWSYHIAYKKLEQRFARTPPKRTVGPQERWIALVGIVLIAGYLLSNANMVFSSLAAGNFLIRNFAANAQEFVSGEAGVRAFFLQIQHGFLFVFAVYAVMKRNRLLILLAAAYFLVEAITANGSRFTLLSSLLAIPLALYLIRWRRPQHRRIGIASIYGAVYFLPLLAALLLGARQTGTLSLGSQPPDAIASQALVSFDPMDHLINYLYLMPVDWTGARALEDFWQVIPRALYPDKPFVYGMMSLQEQMYPGSKGAGTGTLIYGDYPLSMVVEGLDFYLVIGFLLHAILAGLFLALLDAGLESGSLLATAYFLMNIFFLYHLIRTGIVNYMLGVLASTVIPIFLAVILIRVGAFRLSLEGRMNPTPVKNA